MVSEGLRAVDRRFAIHVTGVICHAEKNLIGKKKAYALTSNSETDTNLFCVFACNSLRKIVERIGGRGI